MEKYTKYNGKRGKTILRVQMTPSDEVKEWELLKKDLTDKSGDAKKGIYELHAWAKKNGYFSGKSNQ